MTRVTHRRLWCVLMPLWLMIATPVAAEVIRIEITSREPFGDAVASKIGPYERLRGRVVYALDPTDEANGRIVDLGLAITGDDGRVQFYGDLEIIVPVDRAQAQPTVLYVVNNRGRRTWGSEPFFLSRGYVTVSSGWIAQVPVTRGLLRLEAPVAVDPDDGIPVVGLVRAELQTDVATDRLAISNQLTYEPVIASLDDATLTRRLREADPSVAIARDQWRLGTRYDVGRGQWSGRARDDADRRFRAGCHLRVDLRGARLGGPGDRVRGDARPGVLSQIRPFRDEPVASPRWDVAR